MCSQAAPSLAVLAFCSDQCAENEGREKAHKGSRLTERRSEQPSIMGFNRRKMEDQRRQVAEKEAAGRRATEAQVLEDAERLIAAWNERQAKRMPMLFSPTIGAAIKAGYWFLWVRCPACRTINAIDLRGLDRHPDAAVSSLIPAFSAAHAGRMRHLPSWCGSRRQASPMKCGKNIVAACWVISGFFANAFASELLHTRPD